MLIFKKQSTLKEHLMPIWDTRKTIGFVPTMGALHEGHLSLLAQSVLENEITIISIFVNPTQFNNPEDLKNYPRTWERDVKKVESVNSQILIYAPEVDDIYGSETKSESFSFDGLEHEMEGKFRPGHFDGVGTIVSRLFEIVKPTKAYFGEKDFQQLQIVKKLVEKQKYPIQIIGCPIFRESNGLAMSSRNERLTSTERSDAALLFKTLQNAKQLFAQKSITEVRKFVHQTFSNHPTFTLDYFEIAREDTLKTSIRKHKNVKYRAFIAVFVNNIRLIDTISLN
jgi:pantoate--beta-alanine ligase